MTPRPPQHSRTQARGVTLLVLVMLALAASPTVVGRLETASANPDRGATHRITLGGETAIRVERQVMRRKAEQRVQPAAVVLARASKIQLAAADEFRGLSSPLIVPDRLLREALLSLPPPAAQA